MNRTGKKPSINFDAINEITVVNLFHMKGGIHEYFSHSMYPSLGVSPSVVREDAIEYGFIGTLRGLKYGCRIARPSPNYVAFLQNAILSVLHT
ncbi:MAG: hypothetical protein LVT47_15845 [Cyanobacteria bacterium LVE1205-1]